MTMKVLTLSIVSLLFAAPVEAANWTGFYMGLNSGAAFGNAEAQLMPSLSTNTYFSEIDVEAINASSKVTFSNVFYTGGIQAGYNHTLWKRVILGLETDFGAFLFEDSHQVSAVYPDSPPVSYTIYQNVKTDWLFTMRPRVGYAWHRVVGFMTGGFALTNMFYNERFTDDFYTLFPVGSGGDPFQSINKNRLRGGWTAGAGIDYLWSERIVVELLYLHTHFDRLRGANNLEVTYNGVDFRNYMTGWTDLHANLVRLSVSWRWPMRY